MKALVFEQTGEARDVLTFRELPEPKPAAGQVLVAVEASPVHPADFSFVRGTYRVKPSFPQVAGLSGAGRVVGVGAGVELALGARVAFRWPGAWAELACVPVERIFQIPDGVPSEVGAQFVVNPITAWGLLEMAGAEPGEWIGLTAASSSVAAIVSALAEERGLRVVGIARAGSLAELASHVQGVAEDEPELAERVRAITGGAGLSALIDCVGGPLVSTLFPALRPGATIVAYGTLSPEPMLVKNATLVYGNLTWRGFGIDRYSAGLSQDQVKQMTRALWAGIKSGRVPLPVQARVALPDFAEGLRLAMAGGPGKVTIGTAGPE
jgi:NADPH:quinone reductase-like Zn-dependent oxidoreductase